MGSLSISCCTFGVFRRNKSDLTDLEKLVKVGCTTDLCSSKTGGRRPLDLKKRFRKGLNLGYEVYKRLVTLLCPYRAKDDTELIT